ncbi:hypothetical protein NB697_000103 [Xanthomonas sacchari]|nr:hypothetical protein [Xanthomonas sacchari]
MRVRGEAFAHQNDTRLRPRACRRCDRCLPRLRPSPHPPLRGTFSRREKGARCAWSPSPAGRGVGVRVRGEAFAHQDSTRLRPHPCPPLRSMSSQASPVPSSAPSGHLLPMGEGSVLRLEPLSPRERGWGEGAGRSLRASGRHQASLAPLSPLRSMFSQASPVPLSAPAGHLLPVGEGSVLRWNVVGTALCEDRSGLTAAQSSRVLFPQPATASTRSDAFLPTMGARPVFRSGNESVSPPSP